MFSTFKKLLDLLEPRERRSMWILLGLTLTMAVLDTVGIASVMPFIAVLSEPEAIKDNPYLARAYELFGFTDEQNFLLFLGVGTFTLLMASVISRSLTLWAQLRFTNLGIHRTACRMVETYLNQPYTWFLNRHSADLGTKVLSEVTNVYQGAFYPALLIVANTMVVLFLVSFLLIVDPLLAGMAFASLGGMYLLVFVIVRHFLVRIGDERMKANHERYRVLNEAFGGIKDVKAAGLEDTFLNFFFSPSLNMAKRSVIGAVISEMPSFVLQGIVFGGMLLLLLYLIASYGSLENAMPVVAIYALSGYRLLPALQGIYRNSAQLRFSLPSLSSLHADLTELEGNSSTPTPHTFEAGIELREKCSIVDITYSYPNTVEPALSELSVDLDARTTIGLIGSSGSGKTTLVDILLGLLTPESGRILLDGVPLDATNLGKWQRSIGYVSQNIFLTEGTIASNIAFGAHTDNIDMEAVKRAAEAAQLGAFLEELPLGLNNTVGEKGVRLSGGQRQRIGIARALYHDPSVLILDEATSALDNITEQRVMESIHALGGKKTIVLIAHRLSTVKRCDVLHVLDGGTIVASGDYEHLRRTSTLFQQLEAGSSESDQDDHQRFPAEQKA